MTESFMSVRVTKPENFFQRHDNSIQAGKKGLEVTDACMRSLLCSFCKGLSMNRCEWFEEPFAPDETTGDSPRFIWNESRLSEVEWIPSVWLWPSYLVVGKLHCLYGLGGVGKTLIVMQWIASLTTGQAWPDGAPGGQPETAVFLTAEDGVADTILPRLKAAGGDLEKTFVFDNVYEIEGKKHFFNLSDPDSLEYLEIKLREHEDVRVLVIDPITAFLGGADSHKIGDVRSALFPLSSLAERLGIAVIFIHHFNKASGQNAQHRASGSTAFVDAVRIAIMACDNPDDPGTRRVLKVVKSNLAVKPPGIGYVIHSAPEFDTARIEWEREPITKSDAELMSSSFGSSGKPSAAEALIMQSLSLCERPAKEVIADGRAAGLTEKEIRTARENLKVVLRKDGFGKNSRWYWRLPDGNGTPGDSANAIDAIDAHSHERASMGANANEEGCA